MKNKEKTVVIGFVRNNLGDLLVCQRYEPELPEVHLKWDLPGGTNEDGESLEGTLLREISEETGLNVLICGQVGDPVEKIWSYPDHDQHTCIYCFECEFIDGEIDSSDQKINDIKWVSGKNLNSYNFLETTNIFINRLR